MKNNHGNNQTKRNQKASRKHLARKPRHRNHLVLTKRTAINQSFANQIVGAKTQAKIQLQTKPHLPVVNMVNKSTDKRSFGLKGFPLRKLRESKGGNKDEHKQENTEGIQKIEQIENDKNASQSKVGIIGELASHGKSLIPLKAIVSGKKQLTKTVQSNQLNQASNQSLLTRWSKSPRISGAVAAVLLFAMLVAAIIPTSLSVKAEEYETAGLNPTMQLAKEYIYAGSRMLAIEDYGLGGSSTPTPTPSPSRTNVALTSNGGTALASSELYIENRSYPVSGINNGDRKGLNWESTGGWSDSTPDVFPDWVQINFNDTKEIDEIDIFTIQDDYTNPVEPTEIMTFSLFGITAFDVQYWNGLNWVNVPNGTINNNNKVWNKFTFSPITTNSIRVTVNNALGSYCRIVEVEAFGTSSSTTVPPPPTPTPTPTITPTPTPTPDTPTPTPTPATPTPTPAPAVPTINSVTANTDPTCLDITLNGVSGADSYNVKVLNSGYTINVTSLSFPWCGLAPATYYEYQAQAVNQYGTSDWSGIVGGTTANPPPTPTPTPESYTLSVSDCRTIPTYGTYCSVYWTSSVNRPANTDAITFAPASNPSQITVTRQTSGGTSGSVGIIPAAPLVIRFMKDGTTEVASKTIPPFN